MKRAIIATLLTLACTAAHGAEQLRTVSSFKTIEARGPVSLVVEAGKKFSMRVEGEPDFIERVTSEVVNGELRLDFKEGKNIRITENARVIVTMPELTGFRGEGAGQMILRQIHTDRLDIRYRGAGRLEVQGQVRQLSLHAEGVGEIDSKKLQAQIADVHFRGIGAVAVHASERLDASVQGMGTLTYYGNPRTVNKSVSGIGSVIAAK